MNEPRQCDDPPLTGDTADVDMAHPRLRRPSSAGQITVGVGQLRSDTIGLMRRVAAGATVLVMRRGRVTARIESARADRGAATPPIAEAVSVTQLRDRAGWWLDHVARGHALNVVQHGQLVAHLRNHDADLATARPRRVK